MKSYEMRFVYFSGQDSKICLLMFVDIAVSYNRNIKMIDSVLQSHMINLIFLFIGLSLSCSTFMLRQFPENFSSLSFKY